MPLWSLKYLLRLDGGRTKKDYVLSTRNNRCLCSSIRGSIADRTDSTNHRLSGSDKGVEFARFHVTVVVEVHTDRMEIRFKRWFVFFVGRQKNFGARFGMPPNSV